MINQSIHFEVDGEEAVCLMQICQNLGVQPADLFKRFTKTYSVVTPYNQKTMDYLLSSDSQKQYERFSDVDALFADLLE